MNIEIAGRLRPFSSTPGTPFLLPGTSLRVKVYPAAIVIDNLSHFLPRRMCTLEWKVSGPVKNFSVTQDLERGEVCVQGEAREGYYRYRIDGREAIIACERAPEAGLAFTESGGKNGILRQKQEIRLIPEAASHLKCAPPVERLSLGSHKKQDWDLIRRRGSFLEIFPLWYRLGQMTPFTEAAVSGTASLLDRCRKAIGSGSPETILEAFNALYLAGFEGGLSPRLIDEEYQGFGASDIKTGESASPLYLAAEGARLIRSLFIQEESGKVKLLPALPPEFSCGRLVNSSCGIDGQLSIEWTKKMLHKVFFAATASQNIAFEFSRGETSCRLRRSCSDRGVKYLSGQLVAIGAGEAVWFDRFEK